MTDVPPIPWFVQITYATRVLYSRPEDSADLPPPSVAYVHKLGSVFWMGRYVQMVKISSTANLAGGLGLGLRVDVGYDEPSNTLLVYRPPENEIQYGQRPDRL